MSFPLQHHVIGNGSSNMMYADNESETATEGLFSDGQSTVAETETEMRWGMLSLSILIVATASGNILVCLAVTWERRLQNMTNYFLMSLAIADLLVSLLVMPLAMIVELFGYFPLGQSLCVIWATMDVLLCTASIWHMCTMSMDRYFTIRYPIRYGRNKTKKMMTLKITFVWIISFAVSAPLAIAGFVDYTNVYAEGKCTPSIKNFVLYGSIFAFYVPLIIMVTTYALTIRILRQNRVLMSGLDGKSRLQVTSSAFGDSTHRGNPKANSQRYSDISRLNGVGLSPPQSGFTITSVGMTSAKCSSGESPMSPSELQGFNNRSAGSPKRRPDVLKVNLADETNYVNCTFDQVFLDSPKKIPLERTKVESRSNRPKTLHPSHSTSSSMRVSQYSSHPSFSQSRSGELWEESLLLQISKRFSDTNLANLKSDYSQSIQSCFASNDPKLNGTVQCFRKNEVGSGSGNVMSYSSGYYSVKNQLPISFRFTSSSSVENVNADLYSSLESPCICLRHGAGKVLKNKTPSCLTTHTTDNSGGPCPLGTGRFRNLPLGNSTTETPVEKSWNLPKNKNNESEKKLKNTRSRSSDMKPEVSTSSGLMVSLVPNGISKGSVDIVCKEDDGGEEARGLLVSTGTDFYRRSYPSSWNRCSPSIETSPSRSENRTFTRTRMDTRRKPPRACARKIGLLSKSRSTNEQKASKVLGIIFAVFVLFWTPFFTMNIVSVVCESCMNAVTPSMITSMVWLGYLSSLANPIIYTMFSTSFRTVFYRILTCQYNDTIGCSRTSRQMCEERFLCWSKDGRSSCFKQLGCDSKVCGL